VFSTGQLQNVCCGGPLLWLGHSFHNLEKFIHCKKRTALFRVITQKVVLIPYWCFETSFWSHLQEPRIQKGLWNCHYSLH